MADQPDDNDSAVSIQEDENVASCSRTNNSSATSKIQSARRFKLRKTAKRRKVEVWDDDEQPDTHRVRRYYQFWSLQEKRLLLDGVRKYGVNNIKLIASHIGTRDETQVLRKIVCLGGKRVVEKDKLGVNQESEEKYSPIELWHWKLTELLSCEETDHSDQISEILKLIAHYEQFDDLNISGMSWSNIYTFLAEVHTKKLADLPKLSDLESLVLLELMADLGQVLHGASTNKQRRLMEYKYQMMRTGTGVGKVLRSEKPFQMKLVMQALANDFTGLEEVLIDSVSGTQSQSPGACEDFVSEEKSPKQSFSKLSVHNTDVSDGSSPTSTLSLTKELDPSSSIKDLIGYQDKLIPVDEVDPSKQIDFKDTAGLELTFVKPKLFTLNPLCIPPHLMDFETN